MIKKTNVKCNWCKGKLYALDDGWSMCLVCGREGNTAPPPPPPPPIPPTPEERFWSRVHKTDTCWNWLGTRIRQYGVMRVEGRNEYAHRLALRFAGIEVPDDLVVHHICRNTLCVRSTHLELMTLSDHVSHHHELRKADRVAEGLT